MRNNNFALILVTTLWLMGGFSFAATANIECQSAWGNEPSETFLPREQIKFEKTWRLGGDLYLNFRSDQAFIFDQAMHTVLLAHLPGLQEVSFAPPIGSIIISHRMARDFASIEKDNSVNIYAPWTESLPDDLVHLFYNVARKQWLKKQIFPVHGACFGSKENGYSLAVGASGAGKTSLTLHSVLHHRSQIFSGDKTLIRLREDGRFEAIAGTKALTLRTQDADRWSALPTSSKLSSSQRISFTLESEYYEQNPSVILKNIYLIKVNDGVEQQSLLSPLSALHMLFPLFLDRQREDVLLAGATSLIDGSLPPALRLQLAKNLEKGLESTPAVDVAGSLQHMSALIHNRTQLSSIPVAKPFLPKKVLFGICGIGRGHSHREAPIVTQLLAKGHKIMIFTYGQGLVYFRESFPSHPNLTVVEVANPYVVGDINGLNFELSAASPLNNLDFTKINFLAMNRANREFGRPDFVFSDYESESAKYAYAKNAPLVTIDQQSKFLLGSFPETLEGTSYRDEVERLQMFFPLTMRRLAVSFFRVPKSTNSGGMNVEIYPPLIRPEILNGKGTIKTERTSIVVYTSPQNLGTQPFSEWLRILHKSVPDSVDLHIFLPSAGTLPANNSHTFFYKHGDKRFDGLLLASHGIITTAGHTLLSEAMFLEIPVYAIPLPLYEQQLNAKVIQDGGFGINESAMSETGITTFVSQLATFRRNIVNDRDMLIKGSGNESMLAAIQQVMQQ